MKRCPRMFLASIMVMALAFVGAWAEEGEAAKRMASTLPDLSGLAWLGDDLFIAVHDAKNPEENHLPRVSLLWLPRSIIGVVWAPVEVAWPGPQGLSSDLESAARIPGTRSALLVESGEGGPQFRRIVKVEYREQRLETVSFTEWPAEIENVEGSAVAQVGERLVFIYAERAEGQPSTELRWADLNLEPLTMGEFQGVSFASPDPSGPHARHVTALEVDSAGRLYVASAFDPGDDDGPFRSVVWRVGTLEQDEAGNVQLVLAEPERLATLDGFKVESLAIREHDDGTLEIFAGMDDENYGGALRLLPLP